MPANLIQIILLFLNLVTVVVIIWTLIIFRKDIMLRTRPWVGVTSIEFDVDSQDPVIDINFNNIGNLPAISVSFEAKLIPENNNQSSISHTQKGMTVFPSEPSHLGYGDEKLPGLKSLVSSKSKFKLHGVFKYSYGKNNYQTKIFVEFSYYENEAPDEDGVISGHVEWDNVHAT